MTSPSWPPRLEAEVLTAAVPFLFSRSQTTYNSDLAGSTMDVADTRPGGRGLALPGYRSTTPSRPGRWELYRVSCPGLAGAGPLPPWVRGRRHGLSGAQELRVNRPLLATRGDGETGGQQAGDELVRHGSVRISCSF
ncbi:hypothetical protein NDU88_001038 [Pleurodeles waltl]|uniref:Uncharacterized protein n=1 Tax=Pleurodeles waltl TaxID=8319 RepID=A0AAV7R6P7_PLEWA|nr:hypothetical protein NDU88_001038 [Pleurodeles waltl]